MKTCTNERCERLKKAIDRATEAGFHAVFDTTWDDATIPDDADKILVTTGAVISLFVAMLQGAQLPENALPRRLLILKMQEAIAPEIAKLYEAAGHA